MTPRASKGAKTGRRGGLSFGPYTREQTSKRRLEIKWKFPTATHEEKLDFQASIRELRGNDPRPLLIIRECGLCKGEDAALFNPRADNEKAKLMTRWFNCIKLPPYVTDPRHRWQSLFPGKRPAHGILVSWDGKTTVELAGDQSRKVLHDSMMKVLKTDYKTNASKAISSWYRTLSQFDYLDVKKRSLTIKIERVVERHGPKSPKLAKLQADIKKVQCRMNGLLAREERISKLEFKRGGKPQSHSVLLDEIRKKPAKR